MNEIAKVFFWLILVMGVAPFIAYIIDGLITYAMGWRYIFLVLALISVLLLIASYASCLIPRELIQVYHYIRSM